CLVCVWSMSVLLTVSVGGGLRHPSAMRSDPAGEQVAAPHPIRLAVGDGEIQAFLPDRADGTHGLCQCHVLSILGRVLRSVRKVVLPVGASALSLSGPRARHLSGDHAPRTPRSGTTTSWSPTLRWMTLASASQALTVCWWRVRAVQ